jgi:hypothetical protein
VTIIKNGRCPHSKGTDHKRKTVTGCPYNKNNLGKVGTSTTSTTSTVVPVTVENYMAEKEKQGK